MANNTNLSFPSAFCQQFFKDGKPLSCGKLYTYIAGSSTSVVTYKTISGGTESANMNTNPIILDMSGKANLVISKDTAYKFVLFDRNDVKVDEWDNVTAGGGEGGGSSEEIVVDGTTNEINVSSNITQGVKHYVVSLSNTIKNAILSLLGLYENVAISLENKADKVQGATTGNLAALDAEGNLSDSGSKVRDFKTKQTPKSFNGSTTKTITNLTQDANGEIIPEFSDIDFDSKVLTFYPQSLAYMTPDEREALNAKMEEVAYNGGFIILWGGRNANYPCVLSFYDTNEYHFYRLEKYENKIDYYEEIVTYDPVTKTFNVDSSSTSINPSLYEKLANKKKTFSGFETSDTFYPTLKAVVDYLDSRLQNVGGKKITNNGVPFTAVSQLPTTTPYYGQNINTDDYAYVQDTGLASRYTAIVTGQSVAWSLDYEIAIPVFTAEQQAAIDSTINSTKVGNYDAHLNNTNNPHDVTAEQVGALTPNGNGSNVTASFTQAGSRNNIATGEKLSVIFGKIAKWFADLKAVAFSGSYSDLSDKPTIPAAANNGVLTIKQNGTSKGTFSANQSSNTEINVTDTTYESKSAASGGTAVSLVTTGEKYTWNAKQNAINDLAEIRSGAASGATALQPSGNGSNVTATFSEASSRSNISSGESLATIFGKIKRFFSDLKSVAFTGNYSDLSGTPTIPAAANNGVLTITQNGVSKGTFSANQSGNNTIALTDTTKVEINNNVTGNILFTTRSTSGEIIPYTGNNLSVDPTKGFTGVMAGTIGANATLGFNIDVSGFNNHIIPTSSGDSLRDFLSKVKKLQVDMDAAPNCVPIDCAVDGNLSESCFYLYIYRGRVNEGVPVRLTISELWKVIKGFIGSTSATGLGLDKDYYNGTAYNAIYDDTGNQIRATYATRTALRNKSTSAYNEVNVTTPDENAYLYFEDIDMSVRLEIKNISSTYYYGLVMKRNVKSESIQVSGSAMLTSQASGQPSPNSEIKRIWTSVNNVNWSNFGHFTVLQANASVDYAATGKIQFKCGSFMVSVDVSITKAGADANAYVFMTGYTSPCVAGHNTIPVV